ncbi:hypothetical protein [Variovorax saccharolyticus]|uniref:hypothetical protein n=1 Tax=Variovorax saccharolyticus TaxID=3053516 RepID=UPI002576759A|nr:hypothetical protein [Variovorax sp. J22R187]MDM0021925.1 hypothetical protein [Variovorax sp. J22R187]
MDLIHHLRRGACGRNDAEGRVLNDFHAQGQLKETFGVELEWFALDRDRHLLECRVIGVQNDVALARFNGRRNP